MTIVLLPGMDGTDTLYDPLRKASGGYCKLIVASYPVDQVLDYATLETVARCYLPVDEDYILLGESFSGPIAISIAASHPPGLLGLILCASFASNPKPWLAHFRHVLPYLPLAAAPAAALNYFLLGKFSTLELRELLVKALATVLPKVLKARMRCVLLIDNRHKLASIKVPVHYLYARQDRLVPFSAYTDIYDYLPATLLHEFDAPHFLLQTKATEVAALIGDLLPTLKRLNLQNQE
ncbi:alpha/beta fold hydrolase [Undibacterium sp. Ji42W]